jgi:hypothetical protein
MLLGMVETKDVLEMRGPPGEKTRGVEHP